MRIIYITIQRRAQHTFKNKRIRG